MRLLAGKCPNLLSVGMRLLKEAEVSKKIKRRLQHLLPKSHCILSVKSSAPKTVNLVVSYHKNHAQIAILSIRKEINPKASNNQEHQFNLQVSSASGCPTNSNFQKRMSQIRLNPMCQIVQDKKHARDNDAQSRADPWKLSMSLSI